MFAAMFTEIKMPIGDGPYCFWRHGQIYHLISPLYPNEGNKQEYGQLYVFDPGEAKTKWLKTNQTKGVCPK